MSCDDLGAELWALVYHLFAKYKDNTALAVQELGLRTHHDYHVDSADALPRTAPDIKGSTWYVDMCAAYLELQKSLRQKHKDDEVEARDLVSSLYPDGCNVSEYADAVRTCAAVLPRTVPTDVMEYFISKKGTLFLSEGVHVISAERLVSDVIDDLMFSVLIPRQWWCEQAASLAHVKRVGLRGSPPTLYIEYERPLGTAHVRRIHLGSTLRENMPTAQLARRLATTHESLLSEAQFQSLLIRCQRLMGQSPPASSSPATATRSPLPTPLMADTGVSAAAATLSTEEAAAAPSAAAASAKGSQPQKADLGLLYRDPDAALQNVDLNDADDVTLREFKEVMNEKFKENVVKPGDPGYVYDKRLEVAKPVQKSDWDDDDSD